MKKFIAMMFLGAFLFAGVVGCTEEKKVEKKTEEKKTTTTEKKTDK